MADQPFNDFVPPEMREFAEQSVEQAKKAFDDLMTATQRAVSTFEGQATSAQTAAVELQRKVVGFSERNVARLAGVRAEPAAGARRPTR